MPPRGVASELQRWNWQPQVGEDAPTLGWVAWQKGTLILPPLELPPFPSAGLTSVVDELPDPARHRSGP